MSINKNSYKTIIITDLIYHAPAAGAASAPLSAAAGAASAPLSAAAAAHEKLI